MDGFSRTNEGLDAAEDHFQLAFQKRERFFEVVTVRRRAATRRYIHIDQTKTAGSIFASEDDRIGVSHHSYVRDVSVGSLLYEFEIPARIIGRNR
jgi:hypothetical protein